MSEKFLDKVLHFMGIQEDEVEEEQAAAEEFERPVRPPAEDTRKGRVVNLQGKESSRAARAAAGISAALSNSPQGKWRISVLEPTKFEDVQTVCDHLKQRRPVLVSVEDLEKELSKRIIDFVSGTTYAIDGQVQRISESIFLFAPSNVVIDAELQHSWEEEVE